MFDLATILRRAMALSRGPEDHPIPEVFPPASPIALRGKDSVLLVHRLLSIGYLL